LQDAISLDVVGLVLRLVAAAALGGLIGLERELADQPAGFRTHMLVSLGAALFTAVGAYGVEPFAGDGARVSFDPTRVAAQVVTGIGFLGAGVIFQQGLSVRGLTTAAALWVTAAVGTAVALGYWSGGVIATLITVGALYGLKGVERGVFARMRRRHVFVIEAEPDLRLSDLATALEKSHARAGSLTLAHIDDAGARHVVANAQLGRAGSPEAVVEAIASVPGVRSVALGS
jgi:putative Mg2+ transporter-C (MgtC) family protein